MQQCGWVSLDSEFNDLSHRKLVRFEFEIEDFSSQAKGKEITISFIELYREHYRIAASDSALEEEYVTEGTRPHIIRCRDDDSDKLSVLNHERIEFGSVPSFSSGSTDGSTSAPLRTFAWPWSGSAAGIYSDTWALSRNPTYREYDNDCTNFCSQCLTAGGKTEKDGDRLLDPFWFYGSFTFTTSYTWAGAQNLKRHLASHTNSTLPADQMALRVGDLVIMEPASSSGDSWHAMVTARKTSNDLLMNYHSQDTKHKSLNSLKAGNPGFTFHHIKVGTSYS